MKFGGTSVGNVEGVKRTVSLVKTRVNAADEVILVISAMSGVTDNLSSVAKKASSGDLATVHQVITSLKGKHAEIAKSVILNKTIYQRTVKDIDELIGELEKVLMSVTHLRELTPKSRDKILSFGECLASAMVCGA